MATIYEVQAPDGSILEIEGPDGASDAQIMQAAAELYQPQQQSRRHSSQGKRLSSAAWKLPPRYLGLSLLAEWVFKCDSHHQSLGLKGHLPKAR
jgi:hypothetical protein